MNDWAQLHPTGYHGNSQSVASEAPSLAASSHPSLSKKVRLDKKREKRDSRYGAILSHLANTGQQFHFKEDIASAVQGHGKNEKIASACERLTKRGDLIKVIDGSTGKPKYLAPLKV